MYASIIILILSPILFVLYRSYRDRDTLTKKRFATEMVVAIIISVLIYLPLKFLRDFFVYSFREDR